MEFDNSLLTSNKRRRATADLPCATARPDVLSGIIGKRVVVPRRSRSAVPTSQPQPPAFAPPDEQFWPQLHPELPPANHEPSPHGRLPAGGHAGKSPAPKDEEQQIAVMGLLSLCKAN